VTVTAALTSDHWATQDAGYLLVGPELGRRSDAMVAGCWSAAGAAMSCLGRGIALDGLDDPSGRWRLLVNYGAATAVAFWLTFAACRGSAPAAQPWS